MKKVMFLLGVMVMFLMTSCIKGPNVGGYSSQTFRGKLEVTRIGSEELTYTDDKALVTITIPNSLEKKMTILFQGVAFAQAMADKGVFIDLELTSIPFERVVSADAPSSGWVFDEKDIIPTGFDSTYKIDRVWGSIGSTVDVRFEMQSKGSKVRFYTEADSTENE